MVSVKKLNEVILPASFNFLYAPSGKDYIISIGYH